MGFPQDQASIASSRAPPPRIRGVLNITEKPELYHYLTNYGPGGPDESGTIITDTIPGDFLSRTQLSQFNDMESQFVDPQFTQVLSSQAKDTFRISLKVPLTVLLKQKLLRTSVSINFKDIRLNRRFGGEHSNMAERESNSNTSNDTSNSSSGACGERNSNQIEPNNEPVDEPEPTHNHGPELTPVQDPQQSQKSSVDDSQIRTEIARLNDCGNWSSKISIENTQEPVKPNDSQALTEAGGVNEPENWGSVISIEGASQPSEVEHIAVPSNTPVEDFETIQDTQDTETTQDTLESISNRLSNQYEESIACEPMKTESQLIIVELEPIKLESEQKSINTGSTRSLINSSQPVPSVENCLMQETLVNFYMITEVWMVLIRETIEQKLIPAYTAACTRQTQRPISPSTATERVLPIERSINSYSMHSHSTRSLFDAQSRDERFMNLVNDQVRRSLGQTESIIHARSLRDIQESLDQLKEELIVIKAELDRRKK